VSYRDRTLGVSPAPAEMKMTVEFERVCPIQLRVAILSENQGGNVASSPLARKLFVILQEWIWRKKNFI
jgi:hypothetical protein